MRVSYPGVYVQEVPSGVRPITAVATSIAAFVDRFREGPTDTAARVQGMGDFNRIFGGLDQSSPASYGIAQFFLNGGTEAWVVRVGRDNAAATDPNERFRAARVGLQNTAGTQIMTVRAANEGGWGNRLRVTVRHGQDQDGTPSFGLTVVRYDGSGAVIDAEGPFLNLSVAPDSARYFPTVINDESRLIRVAHDATPSTSISAADLPAVVGTLGDAVVDSTNLADPSTLNGQTFLIDVTGPDEPPPQHRGTFGSDLTTSSSLQEVRQAFSKAIRESRPASGTDPTHASFAGATVELVGSRLRVTTGRRSRSFVPSEIITFSEDGGSVVASLGLTGGGEFANVQEYSLGAASSAAAQVGQADFAGGDGVDPTATELNGDPDLKTGIHRLADVDLFNILCIPRAAVPHLSDPEVRAVVAAATAFCQERRSFYILDIPQAVNTVEEMEAWIDDHSDFRHRNTAIFFPRPSIPDPLDEYRARSVGASGTVAGVFARTDSTRGVWKAPAGIEAGVRGLSPVGLDAQLTDAQNGTLNPLGVNCLRDFPIFGRVVWGARTLLGADELASEWKYIPIRRLALMIEESLFRGTKWVVFEPNDEPLWAQIRQNVGAFMMNLFRQGAFQGDSPNTAFFVKCDGTTTTAIDRNLGIVNIEVGFAPLKPAEFVVIKIQQIPDVD